MGQVALQAKAPQIDLATIERAAQGARAREYELQNAPARSQLEGLKLQGDIGEQSALANYRRAQGVGEPDAINNLKAYPQVQKQVYDAFDGMKPEEYMFAKKKARAFGRAAQYVLSLPKDSPERKQAWDESLGILRDEGFIDKSQYQRMIDSGPSDLVLQQALTVDDYIKQYAGKNSKVNDAEYEALKKDKIRAEIDKLRTPGAGKRQPARIPCSLPPTRRWNSGTLTLAEHRRSGRPRRLKSGHVTDLAPMKFRRPSRGLPTLDLARATARFRKGQSRCLWMTRALPISLTRNTAQELLQVC